MVLRESRRIVKDAERRTRELDFGTGDGDDDAQKQALVAHLLYHRVRLLQPGTAQRLGRRRLRRERRPGDACDCQHPARGREQPGLVDPGLLAGTIQAGRYAARLRLLQRERELGRLVGRFLQQVVERAAGKVESALQRAIDADVEPRFNALSEELHRHAIQQRAGQHRDQREEQDQPRGQPRAEDSGLVLLAQPQQLVADQSHQHRHHGAIEDEQQVIGPREERRIGACGRQQEQEDHAQARAGHEHVANHARRTNAAHGMKLQRYHSDCIDQSLEARALIWNGLGSWVTSSRRRTAAS